MERRPSWEPLDATRHVPRLMVAVDPPSAIAASLGFPWRETEVLNLVAVKGSTEFHFPRGGGSRGVEVEQATSNKKQQQQQQQPKKNNNQQKTITGRRTSPTGMV